jgi:excinuclease ABC subunit C
MVVFEDGLARRSEYRRFIVRGDTDDLAAMSEVLRRRFARYLDAISESGQVAGETSDVADGDEPDPTTTPGIEVARSRKFAYPPQLLVVDGGAPQVQVAAQVLADLGIDDIAVCGLAKRLEEVWLPGDEFPVILPRTSEALYLLQRVRDEAHRFAITFHRERRSKRMTTSRLDGVPGLGEIRRKALLTRFGSVKRLAAASAEEIASVPGIGDRTAAAIVAALAGGGAGPSGDRPGPSGDSPGPSGNAPQPSGDIPEPNASGPRSGGGSAAPTSDAQRADDTEASEAADRAGASRP